MSSSRRSASDTSSSQGPARESAQQSSTTPEQPSSTTTSATLPAVLLGLVAATFAVLVLVTRRKRPPAPSGPPIGRYGEPGPHWTVEEKVLVHRSAGEVAQHLHDHGGLPGLDGGQEGPAMDRVSWDIPGEAHAEAIVHGMPGAERTEITVRMAPEHEGARQAARSATAVVLGTSLKAQLREDLQRLRRTLEATPSDL